MAKLMKNGFEMKDVIVIVLYLLFSIGGSTLLKMAGESTVITFKGGLSFHMEWKAVLGMCLYVVSFLIWTRILTMYELSLMVPIVTGLSQICYLFVGKFFFKEQLNLISTIGVFVIIGGIFLLSYGRVK